MITKMITSISWGQAKAQRIQHFSIPSTIFIIGFITLFIINSVTINVVVTISTLGITPVAIINTVITIITTVTVTTIPRFSIGDYQDMFSIQSTSKPFTYALALDHIGAEVGYDHIGADIGYDHIGAELV